MTLFKEQALDKFVLFSTLTKKEQEFLEQYKSPKFEASIWKQIPIEYLDSVKATLKKTGYKFRVIYRGPRGHYWDQASTWKQDARAFSLYLK